MILKIMRNFFLNKNIEFFDFDYFTNIRNNIQFVPLCNELNVIYTNLEQTCIDIFGSNLNDIINNYNDNKRKAVNTNSIKQFIVVLKQTRRKIIKLRNIYNNDYLQKWDNLLNILIIILKSYIKNNKKRITNNIIPKILQYELYNVYHKNSMLYNELLQLENKNKVLKEELYKLTRNTYLSNTIQLVPTFTS